MILEKYGDYTLKSYDNVELMLPDFTVSDEKVLAEMERIGARHATFVDAEAHPVKADDIVKINISTFEGKLPFPGLTRAGVDVQLGVGSLPTEIEVALLGHQVGDKVTADFDYVDYSQVATKNTEAPSDGGCGGCAGGSCDDEKEAGQPEEISLHSEIEILAIRSLYVPDITDEWVKKNIALSNTVKEFSQRTRKKLTNEAKREYVNKVEYDVIEKLGERLVEAAPEDVVDNLASQLHKEFDNFLKQYDMDRSTYLATQGMTDEQFDAEVYQDAVNRISQDIALAVYAKQKGIEIDDLDINAMFSQPTPEKTLESRAQAEQTGEIDKIKDLALRAKVAEILTKNATYINPDGSVNTDFKNDVTMRYEKINAVRKHANSRTETSKDN